jgi:hypothetical protein
MDFPPLYKRQGQRIRVWTISVDENDKGEGIITIKHGLEGGTMTPKIRVVSKGKGKKSPYEQAIADAQSKWNDQTDNGGYHESKKHIDKVQISPMLAYDYTKYKNKVNYPAYMQPKLDGCRGLIHKEGKNLITLTRENNLIFTMDHCINDLQEFFREFPDFYLDGEFYKHGAPLQKMIGVINTDVNLKNVDWDLAHAMKYNIFDCFNPKDMSLTFAERYGVIHSFFKENPKPNIVLVKTYKLKSEKDILPMTKKFVAQGYEGSIIRNVEGLYKYAVGKSHRSTDLLKYKLEEVEEYKIVDILEAENKPNTPIFVCITVDGHRFNVNPSGSHAHQQDIYKNRKKYIGMYIRLKYNGMTELHIPKFAQVLKDKEKHMIIFDKK